MESRIFKMSETIEIKVNYTPSVIEIDGRSEIEKEVSELVKKSKNYIVTVETIIDARDMRAKLNGMFNTLEDRRKDVKSKINEPYDEFKAIVDEIEAPILESISELDSKIKEADEVIKSERAEIVRNAFAEFTDKTEIDPRIFENRIHEFVKAANFTKTNNLTKGANEGILAIVTDEVARIEKVRTDKQTISRFAELSNLSDTSYIRFYDQGKTVDEITKFIKDDAAAEVELERRRIEHESAAKEAQAELDRKKQEYETMRLEKEMGVTDRQETGPSVINQTPQSSQNAGKLESVYHKPTGGPALQHSKSNYPARLQITIDLESQARKDEFKALLIANGFSFRVDSFKTIGED